MSAILLLDTSSSMNALGGGKRRIDVLADILASVLPATPNVRLFSFNSAVIELEHAVTAHGVHLPEPEGSTALHRPIEQVAPRVLNYHRDRLPAGAVYIGRKWRHLPASRWGNPFIEGRHGTRAEVIAKYRVWICNQPGLIAALPELRGRNLVCFCAPSPCHGDVLLELADAAAGGTS